MARTTYEELTQQIEDLKNEIALAKSEHKPTAKLEDSLLVAEEYMAKTISRGTP